MLLAIPNLNLDDVEAEMMRVLSAAERARTTQVSTSRFVRTGLGAPQIPRAARVDAFVAILAPVVALLCLPVDLPRGCFGGVLRPVGSNPLRNQLSLLVPHDACAFFPEACGDDGYLSAPAFLAGTDLRLLLVDAGVDLMVVAIAMSAIVSVAAGWTLFGAMWGRRASPSLHWTLFTTVLLVFAGGAFWARLLLRLATV
jgi:hypothetical protein